MVNFTRPQDSPSSLNTFLGCKRNYLLTYCEAEERGNAASPESAAGTAAHYALELAAPLIFDDIYHDDRSAESDCYHALKWEVRKKLLIQPNPDRTLAWAYGHAEKCTRTGMQFMRDLRGQGWGLVEAEMPVEHEVEPGWVVGGIADLVLELDGAKMVLDWKTGSLPAPRYQDSVRRQLLAYALATGAAVTQAVYLGTQRYYGDTIPPKSITLSTTDEMLAGAKEELRSIRRRIEAEREWQPTTSALCAWCAHSKGLAKNEDGERIVCHEGAEFAEKWGG